MKTVKEANVPIGARQKMPFWYPLIWSSRGVTHAINYILVGYVTFFATDIIGMNATSIGLALVVSKVIDACTDLVAGVLVDKTHTKLGKARPYEFFVIGEWLFMCILYAVPTNASTAVQYAWIIVMYVMISAVSHTALGASDSVYCSRAFTTENNRIRVISTNGFVIMLGSSVFSILFPQFLNGAGVTQSGWIKFGIIMAVPCTLIGLLRFFFCKEIAVDQPAKASGGKQKSNISIREMIGALLKNKYFMIVVGLYLITNIVNNITVVNTYYFKYIVGNLGLLSLVSMTSLITPLVLIFFPMLSRKFGTTKILQCSFLLGAIGILIRTFGGTNLTAIMIGAVAIVIGGTPITTLINTYLIDCMDYGEWKTGIRVEGPIASVNGFAGKVGSAMASGLVGVIMGLVGYNGMLDVQTAAVNNTIVVLFNWMPLVMFIAMFILSLFYRVDSIRGQMNADLQARREAKN